MITFFSRNELGGLGLVGGYLLSFSHLRTCLLVDLFYSSNWENISSVNGNDLFYEKRLNFGHFEPLWIDALYVSPLSPRT